MKHKPGSKVVIKDRAGIFYSTCCSEPVIGEIKVEIVLDSPFSDISIDKNYRHGLYYDVIATLKIGEIQYCLVTTACDVVNFLVDEDSLVQWEFTKQDMNMLRQKANLLSDVPNFVIKPSVLFCNFPVSLIVSEING